MSQTQNGTMSKPFANGVNGDKLHSQTLDVCL